MCEIIRNILLVAAGGAAGSMGRYLVSRWLTGVLPWGTLTVNIVGSLLIGLLMGMTARGSLSPELRLLLVTGFCGGFTTFSTFASESLSMMKAGDAMMMALYVGVSVTIGMLAVFLGMEIGK